MALLAVGAFAMAVSASNGMAQQAGDSTTTNNSPQTTAPQGITPPWFSPPKPGDGPSLGEIIIGAAALAAALSMFAGDSTQSDEAAKEGLSRPPQQYDYDDENDGR